MGRALKRVLPRQHLVHQDPHGPPVHGGAPRHLQQLGGQVQDGPAGAQRLLVGRRYPFFRQPKVDQLHVPFLVQHHVLQLQVSVHDALLVQVVNGQDQLRHVKLGRLLAEVLEPRVLHAGQVVVQVAPRAKVQHKEQLAVVLERKVHAGNERVVRGVHQHPPLGADALDLLLARDATLEHRLHSVDLSRFVVLHQHHRSEPARAKPALHREVLQARWPLVRLLF
mmetsp:Transcript_39123/g.66590  ORF Transcript_39123/g.66590 Transcript_39123/m.66590 type:complete len:224 (+) Transcript_39123:768-1439(+)